MKKKKKTKSSNSHPQTSTARCPFSGLYGEVVDFFLLQRKLFKFCYTPTLSHQACIILHRIKEVMISVILVQIVENVSYKITHTGPSASLRPNNTDTLYIHSI